MKSALLKKSLFEILSARLISIIDLACASCHGAKNPSGGIKLLTATDLQAIAQLKKLLPAIQRKGAKVMPPSYALADCQLREIELWIPLKIKS